MDVTARQRAEGEVGRLRARLAESEGARARLTTLQAELVAGGDGLTAVGQTDAMVGRSAALRAVQEQVARVAPTDTTVLIHGETGSGKELVARSIHRLSPRAGEAFVPVNCAAMPESLIESELFGHERGAFTGADRRRLGKFELADGGTLFLDEIAELPMASQAKLLRVLQERAFERVGGAEPTRVDVRLVAASHRDLARQVERGRFREDLFYRLNVFKVRVPALRERREDIAELTEHLHQRLARRMGRPVLPLSDRSLRRIMAYGWPGNVRELANAVERATLLADGGELEIELPESPIGPAGGGGPGTGGMGGAGGVDASAGSGATGSGGARDFLLELSLEQLERLHITHALEASAYRVFGQGGAAARLAINPNTLLSRMDKYGIPRPRLARRATKGQGRSLGGDGGRGG
ncbi:MAG: Fis family transcriptional regulator [Planctomyces sp.]|nr:Fis family transcriptional regulator [Planctomyces sp.]